jgi:purine-binding chemotaxis protein CheW
MNLAEIRKKAAADKKAVAAVVEQEELLSRKPAPVSPVETDSPGETLGDVSLGFPDIESPGAVGEPAWNEPAWNEPEDLPESLAAEPENVAVSPVAEPLPDLPAAPVARAEEPPALAAQPDGLLHGAAPQSRCGVAARDLLATIIAGRESVLEAETAELDKLSTAASAEIEEYLCFRVAEEEYAINILSIKEIIKPREVTEVPRMPAFISGVISLRGVIIPIMDMRCRLSLPTGVRTGRERVIVVKSGADFCGILVDWVVQVARIRRDEIEAPPAVLDGIDREFVMGLGHFDGRMIILLNLATILNIGLH